MISVINKMAKQNANNFFNNIKLHSNQIGSKSKGLIKQDSLSKKVSLLVCVDSNFGFGKNNQIPWMIREDMNFFQDTSKRSTNKKRNCIIMGKNTWFSLPEQFRGLTERTNIVVSASTTQTQFDDSNKTKTEAYLVKHFHDAINTTYTLDLDHVFIGGGYEIYNQSLQKCFLHYLYFTIIDYDYECDKIFPCEALEEIITGYNIVHDKTFSLMDHNTKKKHNVRFIKLVHKDVDHDPIMTSDKTYLNLLGETLETGNFREGRNGNTFSLFGKSIAYDLAKGFPLLTTKTVSLPNIFKELMFFINGNTNTNLLKDQGVNIWNGNTNREFLDKVGLKNYVEGDMGPMYGFQWRHFDAEYSGCNSDYTGKGCDQLMNCINLIKNDPHSRRIVMTTFNPKQANQGCLYPCHGICIQFYVERDSKLSCLMLQRSGDLFLGIPYNIASYALLVHMICEVINNDPNYTKPKLTPGQLLITIGDVHIYESHQSQVVRQLLREPVEFPKLTFGRTVCDLTDFKLEDLVLTNYNAYPNIPAKMVQ